MRSPNGTRALARSQATDNWLLTEVVRRAGRWLIPLVALAAVGAAATVALPALLGRAVDELATAVQNDQAGWGAARGTLIATTALLIFTVAVEAVSRLVVGVGTVQVTGALRRRLSRHILGVGPDLARRTAEGDLVARLVTSTGTTGQAVAVVAGLAAALIPPVGAVAALAIIDPWLAATFAAGILAVSGTVRLYLRDARTETAGYLRAQGAIAARLTEALAGARTIAAARTTDREVERVLEPLTGLRQHGNAVWRLMARLAFRGEPVVLLTQVAVIAAAGYGVAAGRLSAGEMLAASRYAVMAAAIGSILDELAGLARARAAAQRVSEVLREPVAIYGDSALPPGPGQLEFRHVTAGPQDAPVLTGFDLTVPGGCTLALVGRSGAGKSLVAALAGRLSDPREGEVRLDDVPLPQLTRLQLRHAVVYAFERPSLPGATLEEAIGFGARQPSPARIREAARAARADEFIGRMPGGYAAPTASTPMSGGELQRVGLARALAHDARLLILDDATSSLDTATEAQISSALTTEASGRTRLIVTHRAGTAARADLVAWLDGGRVRALGPHRDLWTDPDYQAIFRPVEQHTPPVPVTAAEQAPAGGAP